MNSLQQESNDTKRLIDNLEIAKKWMQHETVYAYDSPHEQGRRRGLAASKRNVDEVIEFLRAAMSKPQELNDTKRLIRQAIKQLEECMCAGSDGRRKNLDICDRLRAAMSKTRGGKET